MAESQPTWRPADDDVETERWIDVPSASAFRRPLRLVAMVYVLATFVAGPVVPGTPSPTAHWKLGPIYLGRPIVTWGDSPHYLVVANSLVEDRDLDLRNNYDQARAGDWDVGTRFRGADLDRHVEIDRTGRELSFHSPFLPALLATVTWPFRGTEWVESLGIWATVAVTLAGLCWAARLPGLTPGWLVALALATPLWAYARDVTTEPYHAAAWVALLVLEHPLALAAVALGSVMTKVSFAVVPLALGAVHVVEGDRKRGLALMLATMVAILLTIAAAQWIFRDSDHFSLFHLAGNMGARRAIFRPRVDGPVGLLFDPQDGLLPFCPFVVLGFFALIGDRRLWIPALAFYVLHASYSGWRGGSAVSARHLVPMLPVLVLAVSRARPPRWLASPLVAYSAAIAVVAGLLPVAAYDKTPWEIAAFLAERIRQLFG